MAPDRPDRRMAGNERRSGREKRRDLFASFENSQRRVWERRSYMAITDRRQAMQLTAA